MLFQDADLEPFLKVFIAQLSSSMLHIDKGVQTSTVQVLPDNPIFLLQLILFYEGANIRNISFLC